MEIEFKALVWKNKDYKTWPRLYTSDTQRGIPPGPSPQMFSIGTELGGLTFGRNPELQKALEEECELIVVKVNLP